MQPQESIKLVSRPIGPQIYLACAFFVSSGVVGLGMGHSAVLLPRLQSENSSIVIDEDTGSWIVSLYSIVGPVGCLVAGLGSDFWGRRTMNIIGAVGTLIGWVLIACSQNAAMIVSGRAFEGFSRSITGTAMTISTHELADPKYRGFIFYGIVTSIYFGVLVISTFGAYLEWEMASAICSLLALVALILYFFLPESPIWFARRRRFEEAERALKWIWRSNREAQIKEELNDIIRGLQVKEEDIGGFNIHIFLDSVKTFFKPEVLKPFLIMHFFNTIQVFCGINMFTFYTVDILSKIRGDGIEILDDYNTTIVISALRLIVTLITSLLTFKIGRRIFAITSGVFSFIPAIILGVLLYLQTSQFMSREMEAYIKFIILLVYTNAMSLGFSVLPGAMIGETQHSLWRGFICGYLYATNDLILGGMLKIYPQLMDSIGVYGLFLMFGVSCAVCTIFVYLFLPETKGLTLQQIENYFKQPNILWVTRDKNIILTSSPKYESTQL